MNSLTKIEKLGTNIINRVPNPTYVLYCVDGDESVPLYVSKNRRNLVNIKDKLLIGELNRIKNFINKNKENANNYFNKIANWLSENKEALLENRLIATYTLESCSDCKKDDKPLPSDIKSNFIEKIRNGHLTYLYTIDEYLDKDKVKSERPKMDHFYVDEERAKWSGELFIKEVKEI